MRIKVGSWSYVVKLADNPIMDGENECMAFCDEVKQEIIISPACPVESRMLMFLHEWVHAWTFHFGRPAIEEESFCDWVATLCNGAMRELSLNGGDFALRRLGINELVEKSNRMTERLVATRERWCATCKQSIAPAAVMCVHDPAAPGYGIMTIYCEFCNHLQSWREILTAGGAPSGMAEGMPSFERGAGVDKYLREHPECGVILAE